MMKKLSIFLILLFAIPCAAPANQFWYTGGGTGGGAGDMTKAEYDSGGVKQVAFQIRTMTAGIGLNGGGDLSADRTFDLADTTVTPGSYTLPNITVNAQGQLTVAASGVGFLTPFLMPASDDAGQIFVADAIGGGAWEPVTDLSYLAGQLSVTSTIGPQLVLAYDGLTNATFEVNSDGDLFISPTGDSNFLGRSGGVLNTGVDANGMGAFALGSNTALGSNGMGTTALRFNSGPNSNGMGTGALISNGGSNSNGMGTFVLSNNIGDSANGMGTFGLRYNVGDSAHGIGNLTLHSNLGANSNGVGGSTNYYNAGDFVTAIGDGANSAFLPNVAGDKTFDFGAINATTDRITVTTHGFGLTGTWTNVRYTEGDSPVVGLDDNTVYQVLIVDANTLGFWESGRRVAADITDPGTGTGHKLTPQYAYNNVVCIGNNSSPTGERQVIFNGEHDDMIVEMTLDAESVNITSNITPPALAAQADNWNPAGILECRRIRVSTTGGNVNITGIVAIPDRALIISNVGTVGVVTLVNGSVASSAANQFWMFANTSIQPSESVTILYDEIGKWTVIVKAI